MTDQQDPSPGPLRAHRYMGTTDNWFVLDAKGFTIAGRGIRLKRADALRFAASDEMFEALSAVQAAPRMSAELDAIVEAALDKAKGIT